MKKIILNEIQFKKLINEISIDGQNENLVNKYIKMGYLVHGTNAQFDKFDPSKIIGGFRAEYGYGMYFTDTAYKALEYGNEIYLTKKDLYNFLDLDGNDYSFLDTFDNIRQQIYDAEERQNYVRNNREYDYYENLIDELKSKCKLNDYEDVVLNYFKKYVKNNPYSLEDAFKYVRGNLPSKFDKHISSLLLKCGYDGVKCGNQYVIFNFQLLNNNLIKDNIK